MRILIVEDDRKLAEFVAARLRAERFAVDVVGNGRDGETYANSYAYDLLVLDLMLPHMSGTELLRRARASHPSLPVLVLTARDAIEDKGGAFRGRCGRLSDQAVRFRRTLGAYQGAASAHSRRAQ